MTLNARINRMIKNKFIFTFILMLTLLLISFTAVNVKNSFAGESGAAACNGVYASNPIIYALYLKARGRAISSNDITTYIKIVNPAKYQHDRNNVFLWNKLYLKDKLRLNKLLDYVSSIKYFKNYVKASLSNYIINKKGFYLTYRGKDEAITDGMRTDRNINFIKTEHGNIYYLFRRLTVVYKNAGKFNFLPLSPKRAERFVNKRTGTFGHIKKSVFLEYDFIPLTAKHNKLIVKIVCVKVYNNRHKNYLVGIIK